MGQKVHVTKLFGGGGALGVMDPKVGMDTQQGKIRSVTDPFVAVGSGTAENHTESEYAERVFVHIDVATGVFSYPTGDGSVQFGHAGTRVTGTANNRLGAYMKGGMGIPQTYTK